MGIFASRFKITIALLVSAIVVLSCKDKTVRTSAITDDKNVPTLSITDLTIDFTQDGVIRTKVMAPLAESYDLAEEPYRVFPEGFHLLSFTSDSILESEIIADYALNKEKPEEMWIAIGNVVVTNHLKQQFMKTDTLYWNRATKKIYNYSMVYIKMANGSDTYGADGMTSDEQFENYEIRKGRDGHLVYEEKENSDTTAAQTPTPALEAPITP